MSRPPQLHEDSRVPEIARAFRAAGGRALIVGGWIRDQLLGRKSALDIDLEVQGLSPEAIEDVLGQFGTVRRVGRAFPIYLVEGLPVEVSLPRSDDPGLDGSPPGFDPGLEFAEAARGRDLRVNAMGWDPLLGEILDPYDGRQDLEDRVLRATDASRFGRDPLRALRVARLAAVLDMKPDEELKGLCRVIDLAGVAPERIGIELRKLLLDAERPSRGFEVLRETSLIRFFPELEALVGVPQDPEWHPEGDVWIHTLMALDVAAGLRVGDPDRDMLLMLGVLCHDFGKPATTEDREGRIVSYRHDLEGIPPTGRFLSRMRAAHALVRGVSALVRDHLAPAQFFREAGPRGYRRLLRRLRDEGVDADLLWRVARADHLGRTTEDAASGRFEAGDVFRERAQAVDRDPHTYQAVVSGRHLLEQGVAPGPELGALLERCREIQDETGWTDADAILERARSG